MMITNVDLGDDITTISAKGKMGVYGTVYVTHHLSYNVDRKSGFVTDTRRGAVDVDTVVAYSVSAIGFSPDS